MAFDHRSQLEEMALQCGASLKRIPALKTLILQASRDAANSAGLEGKAGLLCDGTFGQDALNAITGEGWWIGRPLSFPVHGRWRWSTATLALSLSVGRRSMW